MLCFVVVSGQQSIGMEKINKDFEKALHYVTSDNPEKAIPILNQIHKEGKAIGYWLSACCDAGGAYACYYLF